MWLTFINIRNYIKSFISKQENIIYVLHFTHIQSSNLSEIEFNTHGAEYTREADSLLRKVPFLYHVSE